MTVDFHTHQLPTDEASSAIVNLSLPLPDLTSASHNLRFSAGIHPWQLVDLSAPELGILLEQLEQAALSGKLDAIGECGLDRTIKVPFVEQSVVFEHQIKLAEEYHLPLIIHCVRAYSELITAVKTHSTTLPWVIHGFNGNVQQLEQLLKYDIFYFSFGPALLKQPNKFAPLLRMVPKSHLLLETDDSRASIMEIYQQTAKLCGCGYNELTEQLEKNWITLFK
jgi:TatD DNase family protein